MAGQRAEIDKDNNEYRSPNSAPESERETAYHNQKKVEGPTIDDLSKDRNGNGDDVFKGNTKPKQGRHPADQDSKGPAGKDESYSPFTKILNARFGITESENPGVSASSATSDNPSMGMYSVNNSDFKQSDVNVKNMLESIALQAAEAFEQMQENNQIPNALASELDQCTKVLAKLYEYVKSSQRNDPSTGGSPVENDPGTMPVRREETEMEEELYHIVAETHSGESFETESMSEEEASIAVEEMLESDAYYRVEMKLSPKQKKIASIAGNKDKIDADDLAHLRAKQKMAEAVTGVANYILRNGE